MMRLLEALLWIFGGIAIGIFAYVAADRAIFQTRQDHILTLETAHGAKAPEPGSPLGRLEIPRLGLRAIVVESTTDEALRRAVGHIEGTALPGRAGNVGLAGHRDTFFRDLKEIRKNDRIRLVTPEGAWEYRVESVETVKPDDVQVLQPTAAPMLTLVTCYPFHYIGNAPERFVVRARRTEVRSTRAFRPGS